MCCVLSRWFLFLLTASSLNPFITRSPGHVFEACQRTGSLTQSHRFSQTNAATDVVRWYKCILLQSVASFSTIKRRNNSTSSIEWSHPLSHLLTEVKLTKKMRWQHNLSLFQFHARLPCIIVVYANNKESLHCEKNYLFQCYPLDVHNEFFTRNSTTPDLNQNTTGHLRMCWSLCSRACFGD